MKKLSNKYENNEIRTRDNGNVQSYDKEESKLNGKTNGNSGAHTLTILSILVKAFSSHALEY